MERVCARANTGMHAEMSVSPQRVQGVGTRECAGECVCHLHPQACISYSTLKSAGILFTVHGHLVSNWEPSFCFQHDCPISSSQQTGAGTVSRVPFIDRNPMLSTPGPGSWGTLPGPLISEQADTGSQPYHRRWQVALLVDAHGESSPLAPEHEVHL